MKCSNLSCTTDIQQMTNGTAAEIEMYVCGGVSEGFLYSAFKTGH